MSERSRQFFKLSIRWGVEVGEVQEDSSAMLDEELCRSNGDECQEAFEREVTSQLRFRDVLFKSVIHS